MKKQITIFALTLGAIVLGTNNAQAQAQVAPATATTTVSIQLADVISILPGSTSVATPVSFKYNNAEDYYKEQKISRAGGLKVTSTKAFNVEVKANDVNFKRPEGGEIPVSVLKIVPNASSTMTGVQAEGITLSTNNQFLVKNSELGAEKTLDLDYIIPQEKSQSKDILGKPAGTYTQTVTFTASAL